MFRFSLTNKTKIHREPFSLQTLEKGSRLRGATVTEGICPYCAAGCGQLIFSKGANLSTSRATPKVRSAVATYVPKALTRYNSP